MTCAEFGPNYESPVPCTTVERFVASMGLFWPASGGFIPDADITCKVNRCKHS